MNFSSHDRLNFEGRHILRPTFWSEYRFQVIGNQLALIGFINFLASKANMK